jgi:hypothetical protein
MSEKALQNGLFELIGYMLTSARGLVQEPPLYGPLRLLDGVSRLCALLENQPGDHGFYTRLKRMIDEKKYSVLNEEDAFIAMMDEAVLLYTKQLKTRGS